VVEKKTWLGIRTPKAFEIDLVTSEISGYLRSPSPPDFLSVCTHARWENCIQTNTKTVNNSYDYDEITVTKNQDLYMSRFLLVTTCPHTYSDIKRYSLSPK